MKIGDPEVFAVESRMDAAYVDTGMLACGAFYLHVLGRRYGVSRECATYLGDAYARVRERCAGRGLHRSCYERFADVHLLASMFERAYYDDNRVGIQLAGAGDIEILARIPPNVRIRGGFDCAFDDGTRMLQFDVGDQVRVIAWIGHASHVEDVREVWLPADGFYSILERWCTDFIAEWEVAAKLPEE